MKPALLAVAALLLVALPPIPLGLGQSADASAPWWPAAVPFPQGLREGWNLRIALELENPGPARWEAGQPAQIHLDLGALMIGAGWPNTIQPSGLVPKSFEVDFDSIRLVEYGPAWMTLRSPVPVTAYDAWLEPDQTGIFGKAQTEPFDPEQNALVTLEWRLPAALDAHGHAYYYAYFDILQNGDRPAAELGDGAQESLDALYWVGKGTTHYGYHPGSTSQVPTLQVIGTQADTLVTVYTYRGSPFPSLDDRPGSGNPSNPFTIGAGVARRFSLGTSATHFRVDATRPVILVAHGLGLRTGGDFIPSADAGLAGNLFYVPTLGMRINVIAPGESEGIIQYQFGRVGGPLTPVTLNPAMVYNTHQLHQPGQQPAPPPNQLYQLSVTQGGPVLVQYVPDDEASSAVYSQVPTIHGAAVGRSFISSTLRVGDGGYQFMAWDQASNVNIHDLSTAMGRNYTSAGPVDIPTPGIPVSVPGSSLELSPGASQPNAPMRFDTAALHLTTRTDAAIPTTAQGPMSVHSGLVSHPQRHHSTPFGGRAGVEFRTEGPVALYAFYNVTQTQIQRSDGSPPETILLDAGIPHELEVETGEVLHILSDKPLAAIPFDAPTRYARFHSSLPAFAVPTLRGAQYRGYLVDVEPPGGADPAFFNGLPGQTLRVPFQVRNLARDSEGDTLLDRISLDVEASDPTWPGQLSFSTPILTLSSAAPQDVTLIVGLPENLPPNSAVTLTVRATSEGNPEMNAAFSVVVQTRQTFGVQMWFGEPSSATGSKTASYRFQTGQERLIPFVLKNIGSGADSFLVGGNILGGGWTAQVLEAGRPVDVVGPVQPGKTRPLMLQVKAPLREDVTAVTLLVDASSKTSPTFADRLLLGARLSLGQGMQLDIDQPLLSVPPGGSARFVAVAINSGADAVSLDFELDALLPAGWTAAFEGAGHPQNGSLALLPGQRVEIPIIVSAPATARAGEIVSLLLQAQGSGDQSELRDSVALVAEAGFIHRLVPTTPELTVVAPGSGTEIRIRLQNHGNGLEHVEFLATSLPGNWNVTTPTPADLPAGTGQEFVLRFDVPALQAHGSLTVTIDLLGGEGYRLPLELLLQVPRVASGGWTDPVEVRAQPSETSHVVLVLKNRGNGVESFRINPTGPAGWDVRAEPSAVELAPGRVRPVSISWTVPEDWTQPGNLIQVDSIAQSTGNRSTAPIRVRVDVPRVDLVHILPPAAAPSAGKVEFVLTSLVNPSEIPARNLSVRLYLGADLADEVHFESVGPNGTVVAPLRWVGRLQPQPSRVVWGLVTPEGFRELGNHTLELPITLKESRGSLPAPSMAWALLVVTAAGFARRRWP